MFFSASSRQSLPYGRGSITPGGALDWGLCWRRGGRVARRRWPANQQRRECSGVGQGVGRLNIKEDAADLFGDGPGRGKADRQAKDDQGERVAQDHPEYGLMAGSEGDSIADLARSSRSAVGDHAIQPDCSEGERDDAEEAAQRGEQAVLEDGIVDALSDGPRFFEVISGLIFASSRRIAAASAPDGKAARMTIVGSYSEDFWGSGKYSVGAIFSRRPI
jgi:hypothetical protein